MFVCWNGDMVTSSTKLISVPICLLELWHGIQFKEIEFSTCKFTEEFALELEALMELNLLNAFKRKACDEELSNAKVCCRFP